MCETRGSKAFKQNAFPLFLFAVNSSPQQTVAPQKCCKKKKQNHVHLSLHAQVQVDC